MNTDKEQIRQYIENTLRRRIEGHNLKGKARRTEEASYLAGAAAALQAVFRTDESLLTDYVPPAWVLLTLSGRSIFDDKPTKGG
jgi:hypothetical protein